MAGSGDDDEELDGRARKHSKTSKHGKKKDKAKREKKGKKKEHKRKKEKKREHKAEKSVRKRKRSSSSSSSDDASSSSSGLPACRSPPRVQPSNASLCADLYPMPKRRAMGGSSVILAMPSSAQELRRREERASRFVQSAADEALAQHRAAQIAEAKAAQAARPGAALRGSSQMLEKSYTRLTTLPCAADVRPLSVLRQSFELVMRKWREERDYPYAREQLKAIRQDLTVQRLGADGARSAFALLVYEAHARIALEAGDLGEFGACQAVLIPLHATRSSPHLAEFIAYRLLHASVVRGDSLAVELPAIRTAMGAAEFAHPAVAQAWRIAIALQLDDLGCVLREVPRMHHHGLAILGATLARLRERMLRVLCKAFAPSLPLRRLARCLGWADDLAGCDRWLRSLGTVPSPSAASGELELQTRPALRTLDLREAERVAEAQAERPSDLVAAVGPAIPEEWLCGRDW